jgi:hypothetical protein
MGKKMKAILLAAWAVAIGISAARANELAAPSRAQGVRFAAMSLTKDQGVRAIISNVLVAEDGARLAPCPVEVSFFGADGSLIGKTTTVQLKAGESTSMSALHPSKLVRAIVSIGDVVDPAKACMLRTSIEIFDVQTDTTFVSVPGESIGGNGGCGAAAVAAFGTARNNNVSGRKNSTPVATSSLVLGGTVSPNTRSPVLAATPPATPR